MPPDPTDWSAAKVQREVEKLTEEVAKLREDRRWYNRHLAGVVALCGVAATFGVGTAQFLSNSQRNNAELGRAQRDEQRRDTETGLKLLEFAINRQKDFLGTDPDGQVRFIRLVLASLPRDEARRVLSAYAGVASQAQVLEALAVAGIDVTRPMGTVLAGYVEATPSPAGAPAAAPRPAATPAPAAPAAAPAAAGLPAVPVPPRPLVVYAHIAEENDRAIARRVMLDLGPGFPLAGVEFIAAWGAKPRPQGEVRFYRSEQRQVAEALAARLAAAAAAEAGTAVAFRAVDISGNYRNLPDNRVEVWFPQLPGS